MIRRRPTPTEFGTEFGNLEESEARERVVDKEF